MIIKPKIKGFVCTTSHPVGCEAHVNEQIKYVENGGAISSGPKKVLVIGSSTGYGLASRISTAFASDASTLGIFFEKEASVKRPASAGWYNTAAFTKAAEAKGLYAKNINGDAFANDIKEKTIATIKADLGQVDMVVYSLAAPRRTDPVTGEVYKSTLKAVGESYSGTTLDTDKKVIKEVTLESASQEEIDNTIKVMGGEDWALWIDALSEAGVLASGCKTVAYTYIGEKLTWPIYKDATIGHAKEHLDQTAAELTQKMSAINGTANVCVLKAVVTQASSAIPLMPLYLSLLFRVMKEKGGHEGCIEQVYGLFHDKLYSADNAELDDRNRYRMDGPELRDEVQSEVAALWGQCTTENVESMTDIAGYQEEFLKLFGFRMDGVDYDADVNAEVAINNLV